MSKTEKSHSLKQSVAFLSVPGKASGSSSMHSLRVEVNMFNHGEKSRGWIIPHFSINNKCLLLIKGTRNQELRGFQDQQGRGLPSQCLHHKTRIRKARQAEGQQPASPRIQVVRQAHSNRADWKLRRGKKVYRPNPSKQSRHRPRISSQSWVWIEPLC